jgi:hypothetical protein
MSLQLQEWLLACPTLRHASTLAVDAHHAGLIDFPSALAQAVVTNVHLRAHGLARTRGLSALIEVAKLGARQRKSPRLRVEGSTALFTGTIAPGVAIAQSQFEAVLRAASTLPESLTVAMIGRRLSDVIDAPLLGRRNYVISHANCDSEGCSIRFGVPTLRLPRSSPLRSATNPLR